MVSQRGYDEVRYGFSLDQGVMARAVRAEGDAVRWRHEGDPDFIAEFAGITSEIAVPFPVGRSFGGVLNIKTTGATLPPRPSPSTRSSSPSCPSAEEMGAAFGLDLASVARLCVHASSLRAMPTIAEFARTRSLGSSTSTPRRSAWCVREAPTSSPASGAGRVVAQAARRGRGPPGRGPRRRVRHQRRLQRSRRSRLATATWAGGAVGAVIGRTAAAAEPSHEQIEAATLFAQHTAALIDVGQALRREQRAAVTDSLRVSLNRRGLEDRLSEARALPPERPRALRGDDRLRRAEGGERQRRP